MEGNLELTLREETGLSLLNEEALDSLLQPLTREIFLFDTYAAGTAVLKDLSVLDTLRAGDRLTLLREESRFDDYCIRLLNADGKPVGRIPEQDTAVFARLMDAGKLLTAQVKTIAESQVLTKIQIGIYLIDY